MGPRRVLLVIVALVVGLFVAGAIAIPVLNREDRGRQDFAAATVRRVEVTSERGAVRVAPGAPSVERRRQWVLSAPRVRSTVDGGVLRVDVRCPGWAFVSCSADVAVRAPAGSSVLVRAIRGSVAVTGMSGTTDVSSEDGAVDVADSRAPEITARSVTDEVSVGTRVAPRRIVVRSETGTVSVAVPAGAYRLVADSGQGRELVTGVRNAPGAAGSIDATSGLRDVAVTGR